MGRNSSFFFLPSQAGLFISGINLRHNVVGIFCNVLRCYFMILFNTMFTHAKKSKMFYFPVVVK